MNHPATCGPCDDCAKAQTDGLPRKCGKGEADGFGCGLFFGPKDRTAYVEHRAICTRWRIPTYLSEALQGA